MNNKLGQALGLVVSYIEDNKKIESAEQLQEVGTQVQWFANNLEKNLKGFVDSIGEAYEKNTGRALDGEPSLKRKRMELC